MAVKTVQVVINGQTHTLTYNATTKKYEATITAPATSSYNQNGHYYNVKVKATDEAGNSVTKDATACNDAGIDAFFPIVRGITTLEEAMKPENAKENLAATVQQVFRLL